MKKILETKELVIGGEVIYIDLCLIEDYHKRKKIRPFIRYIKEVPKKPFIKLLEKYNNDQSNI